MDYKLSYRIHCVSLGISLALCLFSLMTDVLWPGILGIVLLFAGLLQAAVFYRCPHCGRALNIRARRPHFCPECGEELT